MLRNRDLAFSYTGDDTGAVERASVDSDTQVIASAKRVATRATTDPAVAEIDVDETHFVRGTLNVVYTGKIVFHCRTGEAWCQRVREAATSGSRPRDVFQEVAVAARLATHGLSVMSLTGGKADSSL